MSLIKNSSVKNIVTRSFAAQAAASVKQTNYSLPPHQPEITNLSSGAVLASLENNYPISKIAVFVKSGSKYETSSNLGISHLVRVLAGESTANFTGFKLTKLTQQLGGEMIVEGGREYTSYGLTINRDEIERGFEMVADIALNPAFKPWELSPPVAPWHAPKALSNRLLTELKIRTPSTIAVDLLHKAAFRSSGLGNSLFIPKYNIGKFSVDQLSEFVSSTVTAPRLAFVGIGVEHSALKLLVKNLTVPLRTGAGPSSPGVYGGGEVREEAPEPFAYVAVGGPGAKLGSEEAASLAIAQFILGGNPGTKNGANSSSKLASFVSGAGGVGSVVPINASYTDGGVFGILLAEREDKAGDVLRAVTKGIRAIKISEADVKVAKAKAKAALLIAADSLDSELEDMGLQVLFTGKYETPSDAVAVIDRVTAASVQSALSNATKGKGCLAAYGGISTVPYLDQL